MQRADKQVLFWLATGLLAVLLVLLLRDVLLPFVVGMVIAYFLNPVAEVMTRMGLNRTIASALIVAGVGVVLIAALVLLVPLLISQVQQLAVALPEEALRLKELLEAWARERFGSRFSQIETSLDNASSELAKNWSSWAGIVARSVWSQGLAVVNFVSLLLVTPLVVFYLLVDWHPMLNKVDGWLPRAKAPTIRRLASEINDAVSAFIRGQGTVCLFLGLFYAAGLSWVGLKYGLVIGLATGILAFVPFVGWALGLLTAVALAAVQFWPQTMPLAMVVGVFLAGQALDAAFLSPKIVGSKIGLHPVWLIFSLFVFSYMFGFVGMLVAVPVAAAIAVLVRHALMVYTESEMFSGPPAGPDGPGTSAGGA
jgi:predicted PurR-regulated permease PerM